MGFDPISYAMGKAAGGGVDPSGATALAGDILYPKKAVLADGQLTEGTIQSQAAQTIYPSTSDQTIAAGKYLSGAQTVKGVVVSNTLIPANIADGVTVTIGDADDPDRIMEVVGTHQGGGTMPTLNAPTISLNDTTLSITNPSSNGGFVSGYKVYANGTLVTTTSSTSINLSSVLSPAAGYTVTVKATGTNFNDSAASNAVTVDTRTKIAVPTISGTYTYNGAAQTSTINNEPSASVATKSGDTSATNAGNYAIVFALVDAATTKWADNTTTNKTLSWSIAKAASTIMLSESGVHLTAASPSATVTVSGTYDGTLSVTSTKPAVVTASLSGTTITITAADTTVDDTVTVTVAVTGGTNYADASNAVSASVNDGGAVGSDWATDSWATIQAVSAAGRTAAVYGSQVGATRQITLTDNSTMTIRLSNADDTMYTLSDNSRSSGLCMEFVDCFPTPTNMNSSGDNAGGWNSSDMRTVTMAQLFNLLPTDLKDVIATVNVKATNGGSGTQSVIDSADKLFLLAEKEVFGKSTWSAAAEADVLTRWKWYQDHNTSADRLKKSNGSVSAWWLRSTRSGHNYAFCTVNGNGDAGEINAINTIGVSPGFVI